MFSATVIRLFVALGADGDDSDKPDDFDAKGNRPSLSRRALRALWEM